MNDLERKLVRLLKMKSDVHDVPECVLSAVVKSALNFLPDVFDSDEGETPEHFDGADTMDMSLRDVLDPQDEWVSCEDGSLWPESMTECDEEGVRMPKESLE